MAFNNWKVVNVPMRGVRVYHDGFVEWPIMSDGKVKLARYKFDGEMSSGLSFEQLPERTQLEVKAMLYRQW
jgi:hypothetical protein